METDFPGPIAFVRMKELVDRCGISKAEIYRLIKLGRFPRQRRLSHKVSVWVRSDVEEWLNRRASGERLS
ncbi:MAG: AlpA family phage regulatory protein [Brevundimonas sp.]|uniref:helix-turn-helix transcriptional regulator n=1 Tax=Brevundimonas sp. TaxID=1871086 RepID=UPI0025B95C8B|nr:AlpA family phage regulatory protein [Brevundimonas sp.]MBX3476683.1 AlpA family phage regulatory protein [Brevundimonas sp.]